ncbi:MAG TPA: S28 family serine protease [Candidatus Angelobacter sp.]|nr:S28 family serine protease [Candidatus Angelobacter sp.]
MRNTVLRTSRAFATVLLTLWLCPAVRSQPATPPTGSESELYQKLKALPGVVEVREIKANSQSFKESYEIKFEQPLDHQNPNGKKFQQRFFLGHNDYAKPMLLETEGYAARGTSGGELQRILGGNQVAVEHRFFGRSVPSPLNWEFLTVKQSADDLHAIVSALKTLYPGKWVSSGTSKGGQTALFYKCYYPDDVDATVPYVAPINLAQEDPRIYQFLQTVGDEATRNKIKEYQIAMFKREDEILPLVKQEAERRHWTFKMGLSAAYEYGVLEYPYAFWQFGTKATDIPAPDAPAEKLAEHYRQVNTLYYYSDQGKKQFEPFLYQAFTEIGYYNYDITDFKPYMKTLKDPSNLVICPDGVKIVYNPATMAFVYHFLQYQANHVAYIYGELDAWSATQMQLIGRTDAIKIVVADSHHGARISAFSPEQKELFYSKLEQWLGAKVNRQ